MTPKEEREAIAEREGHKQAIGKKVSSHQFSDNDTAEIVGWGVTSNKIAFNFIRVKNGECYTLSTQNSRKNSNFTPKSRKEKAERLNLSKDLNKKVVSIHPMAFRVGDTAEIVGWSFNEDEYSPQYLIRFENGECCFIAGGNNFKYSGFQFQK